MENKRFKAGRMEAALKGIVPSKQMRYWHAHLLGLSPLLMHKPNVASWNASAKAETPSPEDEAAKSRYLSADGNELVLPATALQRALVNVAGSYKLKLFGGKRQALTPLVAGGLFILPELLPLGLKADEFCVDQRRVVLKASVAVIRGRARIDVWDAHPILAYDVRDFGDGEQIPEALKMMLEETGRRIGLLDFRPQKKGPYGRFEVVEFKEVHPER